MSPEPEIDHGAYAADLAGGKYSLSWASLQDMEIWLKKEEESMFIELWLKETRHHKDKWTEQYIYVCAQQGTGGKKAYMRKFDSDRKLVAKRCGCPCRLIVKSYPNMARVLGRYEDNHSHAIGYDNARFTLVISETRVQIAEMLRMGISNKRIVRVFLH